MRRVIKCAALYALWAVGLFALARRCTREGLRILCYHGGSIDDEHLFMPSLFMRHETFRRRLSFLSRAGYPVLGLDEAIDRLANNTLPPCATVITIDDGFFSTFRDFSGPLSEFHFPATVYITSYHVAKGTPIFRLVVQYMFWKTKAKELNCTDLAPSLSGIQACQSAEQKVHLCWEIINHAEAHLTDPQRGDLARNLGERLGIDYDLLASRRCFNLVTPDEIRSMVEAGIDIQLHTHRHRFPVDRSAVEREIIDNRAFLAGLVKQPLTHFCYPSGLWAPEHAAWLEALGVVSATTCDVGLNHANAPRQALSRFLDCDDVTSIEFAAELCGLSEWLRGLRSRMQRLLSREAPRHSGTHPSVQRSLS